MCRGVLRVNVWLRKFEKIFIVFYYNNLFKVFYLCNKMKSVSNMLGKSAGKKIDEINKRILEHRGEMVFCFREIRVPGKITGDFVPPTPDDFCHYDAGILKGEMMQFLEPRKYQTIQLQHSFERDFDYFRGCNFSIPVQRKISGFASRYRHFGYGIEDLEQMDDGEILIGFGELPKPKLELGVLERMNEPKLMNFHLLIGDKESIDFLSKKETIDREEFFEFLKSPAAAKMKIDSHYGAESKKLANNAVLLVNKVYEANSSIKDMEKNLLGAHMDCYREQDGDLLCSWDYDEKYVNKYYSLRRLLTDLMPNLEKVKGNGKTSLSLLNEIRGDVIGFPAGIPTSEYIGWVEGSLFPEIDKRIEKIDLYLREETKRAKGY